jgi:hypothetical protein
LIDNTVAGTPLTLNLGDALNSLTLGLTGFDQDSIQGPVIVHGGAGTLVTFADDYNLRDTSYTITGSSVSRPASASVTYDRLGRGLTIRGGRGSDTYSVLGTLQNQVTVTAGLGSNTLSIDDESNTADTTYTLTSSSVARTGSGAISYSGGITNLVLTGGSGNNTYNIPSTLSGFPTTLNTGSGTDTVNVRGAAGPLFINSGSSGDTITLGNSAATLGGIGHVIVNDPSNTVALTVDDSGSSGSTTYTLTSSQLAAAAWPNFLLAYNNITSLNLNGSSGNDQFNIESTAGPTTTTITGGSGSNRFDLTPTAHYLAAVAGPLTLAGGGADTLVFWDTANPNAETYTFDDIPSMLALATVPGFATNWSGMAAVYLETNGMSTVNDPSGTVLVDVPPPSPAPSPTGRTPPAHAGLPGVPDLGNAVAGGTLAAPYVSEFARLAPLAAPPLLDWLWEELDMTDL